MPAKDETKFLHIRIRQPAARELRKLAQNKRRPYNEEANIAIESHIYRETRWLKPK